MLPRTLAFRLAPLLVFSIAGSVLAAGKLRRKPASTKPAKTLTTPVEDETEGANEDDSATPARASRPRPGETEGGGVKTKASLETSGYADTDRVYVGSPSIGASVSDEVAGWSLGGHYLVDVVSAASVDILSTASGKWVEVRHVGSADASAKLDDFSFAGGGSISREPDYLSVTGSGALTVDLFGKNVTPFIGISYGQDQVGRTGLPDEFWHQKLTTSARLGTTFVVDLATIASIQADAIEESGYLAKPYRYVPLFAPGQGGSVQPGASVAEVNAVRIDQRPIEQLPNLRYRFALTGRVAHRFTSSTLRLDERAYSDSWGLSASTTDFRYAFDLTRRLTIWPHLRLHVQSGVSFWQRAFEAIPGPNGAIGIPEFRTGDRELSPLYTGTGGFGVRFRIVDDLRKPWSLVFEMDAGYTRYHDALYLSGRRAVFSTLGIEAEF